ncbi:MAG TPA: hypothetical protein VIJ87_04365 [Pyrinomonadaceae bacterium]
MTRCSSQTSAFSITPTTVFFAGLIFLFTILFHTNTVHAQQPPPPAAPSSGPPKPYEPPSLLSGGAFTSIEGRFTISLPQQGHGFSQLTIPTPFGIARGDSYQWRMKEAAFVVGHADAPVPVDSPEQAQKIFESLHEQIKKLANANNGAMREDKQIQLGKYPGIEQRVDLFSAFVVQRTYVVSRRLYQAVMVIKTEQREFESAATKVLDSFKVLEESDVSAKLAEEAKKAEPTPLPQQPVAQRSGTDATDDGMHGQVKTVLEESQDLSGTWSVQTKKRDSFVQYNEQGNRVRQESYDYKGNLDEITVYGYIDRSRVSDFKMIDKEYNPPPGVIVAPPGAVVKKSDPRYQTKFEFKYDEQKRLIEHRWFHSNGELFLRYVYKYNGAQLEELVYSKDGSLNQRYVSKLDGKGNEIERISFDTRDNKPGAAYSFVYEFDAHGNWTKRTASKEGRPQYVDFRTITYW